MKEELEKKLRSRMTGEIQTAKRTIMARVLAWIEAAPTWHLVVATVATYPLGLLEAFLLNVIPVPWIGAIPDAALGAFDEALLLTFPMLVAAELIRRTIRWFGALPGRIRAWLTN